MKKRINRVVYGLDVAAVLGDGLSRTSRDVVDHKMRASRSVGGGIICEVKGKIEMAGGEVRKDEEEERKGQ